MRSLSCERCLCVKIPPVAITAPPTAIAPTAPAAARVFLLDELALLLT